MVRPMSDRVLNVLRSCSVGQVAHHRISGVAIQVANIVTERSRAQEGGGDHGVNRESLLRSIFTAQSDNWVVAAFDCQLLFEYPRWMPCRKAVAADSAVVAYLVTTFEPHHFAPLLVSSIMLHVGPLPGIGHAPGLLTQVPGSYSVNASVYNILR